MRLTLRGHHLLCLKGFQGYGYSEDFTENMTMINSLRKQNSTTVSITNTPDDICKKCPNLIDGICENTEQNKRIIEMDNQVLSRVDSSMEYDAVELFEKTDMLFNSKENVDKICSNCTWHDKCLFYQKL